MGLEVTFYGTRGSISATHEDSPKYGSHTACVVISSGERSVIIDAGFGIGFYSDHLKNKMGEFHLLISHFHWEQTRLRCSSIIPAAFLLVSNFPRKPSPIVTIISLPKRFWK